MWGFFEHWCFLTATQNKAMNPENEHNMPPLKSKKMQPYETNNTFMKSGAEMRTGGLSSLLCLYIYHRRYVSSDRILMKQAGSYESNCCAPAVSESCWLPWGDKVQMKVTHLTPLCPWGRGGEGGESASIYLIISSILQIGSEEWEVKFWNESDSNLTNAPQVMLPFKWSDMTVI